MKRPAFTTPKNESKLLLGVEPNRMMQIPQWCFYYKSPELQGKEDIGPAAMLTTYQLCATIMHTGNIVYRIAYFSLLSPERMFDEEENNIQECYRQNDMLLSNYKDACVIRGQLYSCSHLFAENMPILDSAMELLTGKNGSMAIALNRIDSRWNKRASTLDLLDEGEKVLDAYLSLRASLLGIVNALPRRDMITSFGILKDIGVFLYLLWGCTDSLIPYSVISFLYYGLGEPIINSRDGDLANEKKINLAKTIVRLLDRYAIPLNLVDTFARYKNGFGPKMQYSEIFSEEYFYNVSMAFHAARNFFASYAKQGKVDQKAKGEFESYHSFAKTEKDKITVAANDAINNLSANQGLQAFGAMPIVELYVPSYEPNKHAPVLENVVFVKEVDESLSEELSTAFTSGMESSPNRVETREQERSSALDNIERMELESDLLNWNDYYEKCHHFESIYYLDRNYKKFGDLKNDSREWLDGFYDEVFKEEVKPHLASLMEANRPNAVSEMKKAFAGVYKPKPFTKNESIENEIKIYNERFSDYEKAQNSLKMAETNYEARKSLHGSNKSVLGILLLILAGLSFVGWIVVTSVLNGWSNWFWFVMLLAFGLLVAVFGFFGLMFFLGSRDPEKKRRNQALAKAKQDASMNPMPSLSPEAIAYKKEKESYETALDEYNKRLGDFDLESQPGFREYSKQVKEAFLNAQVVPSLYNMNAFKKLRAVKDELDSITKMPEEYRNERAVNDFISLSVSMCIGDLDKLIVYYSSSDYQVDLYSAQSDLSTAKKDYEVLKELVDSGFEEMSKKVEGLSEEVFKEAKNIVEQRKRISDLINEIAFQNKYVIPDSIYY